MSNVIERLQKDNDAGRELMRQAWHEFNAIRARDGAPVGVSHEWWNEMTEQLHELLGDDSKPWMTSAAKALLAPAEKVLWECEQERDAALAEVERLKGELAEASGQVEWLDKSNNLLRTQIEGFK